MENIFKRLDFVIGRTEAFVRFLLTGRLHKLMRQVTSDILHQALQYTCDRRFYSASVFTAAGHELKKDHPQ